MKTERHDNFGGRIRLLIATQQLNPADASIASLSSLCSAVQVVCFSLGAAEWERGARSPSNIVQRLALWYL